MNPDVVFALVDRIYDASVYPDRWRDFLVDLSEMFGGAAGLLALQLPGSQRPLRYYLVHLRDELHPVLERHYLRGLPWGEANTAPCFRERFALTRELFPDEGLERTDFYAEWMAPQGLAPEGPIAHYFAEEDGVPVAGVAFYRRVGNRHFTDDDLHLGSLLAPHLARAFRLYHRFCGTRHERLALAEVMNRLSIGVVLVDRDRRPVVTNRSADRLVALNDGLFLAADGLHATNERDDAVLQQLLAEQIARAGDGIHADRVMAVSRPSRKRAFPVIITPLFEGAPGDAAEDAIASVLFGDPEAKQAITAETLRSFYDLTPAEAELVGLLAEGYSLEETAARRGVTLNTVRSQLKQVFAKTDTNRQGALVRLVLTGAPTIERE
jgi:DNA-binding CsgD family transcriptional regulator/PAS domain-containing protein